MRYQIQINVGAGYSPSSDYPYGNLPLARDVADELWDSPKTNYHGVRVVNETEEDEHRRDIFCNLAKEPKSS